jgi:hypothetical protein
MVERLGAADLAGVNREGPALTGLLLKSYTVYLEECFVAVAAASRAAGAMVRATVLIDAAGAGVSTLWNINVVKAVNSIGPAHCPGPLGAVKRP